MAIQVIWTPKRCEEFIRLADLDGIEAEIIRIRHRRYGRVKDCDILEEKGYAVSPETYDNIVKRLKHLYDLVQPDSKVLPPRQNTKEKAYEISIKY